MGQDEDRNQYANPTLPSGVDPAREVQVPALINHPGAEGTWTCCVALHSPPWRFEDGATKG
jgi:hypothetical protein